MDDGMKLRLAHGIAEYHTVLTSMKALARMGGPRVPMELVGRVHDELDFLATYWVAEVHGTDVVVETRTVVDEARAYCTAHIAELDELLNDEEEANGPRKEEARPGGAGGSTPGEEAVPMG